MRRTGEEAAATGSRRVVEPKVAFIIQDRSAI
jgi:hypothetical protein